MLAPYNIPNAVVDGYDVCVNKPSTSAYRAPGVSNAAYAVETVMDELAEKLEMDPLEFRLRNSAKEGTRRADGPVNPRIGHEECLQAAMATDHYQSALKGPNQGRGVAVGYRWQGGQASSVTITVNSNGTINLITGSVDIGGSRTAVAMQAAEILGLRAEDVAPTVVDTDSIGWTGVTGGSRTAFDTGLAAIAAAEAVIKEMSGRAALIWEAQAEDVEFINGTFIFKKNPEDKLTFKELASRQLRTGGPISCSVGTTSTGMGPIIAGNIIDVEVDPETGKVDILRCTAFIDAGTAVHKGYVEGQMQGGTVQGIGWALHEEYFYNPDGTMANSSFLDYRMPTILDIPMVDTVITEVPNPRHPFGLRGVGEAPIIPPLAALSNAIYRAVGVRMTKLPMTPGAILEALEVKNSG